MQVRGHYKINLLTPELSAPTVRLEAEARTKPFCLLLEEWAEQQEAGAQQLLHSLMCRENPACGIQDASLKSTFSWKKIKPLTSKKTGRGKESICFCHTFLFIHLFSNSGIPLQSSAERSKQETSYQVQNRLVTNHKGKILLVRLEISFRAHPSFHQQVLVVGLLLCLSKSLNRLWSGDMPDIPLSFRCVLLVLLKSGP